MYLLIGGPASCHQHNVEASEASHRDEEQPRHTHDRHTGEGRGVKERNTDRCTHTPGVGTTCNPPNCHTVTHRHRHTHTSIFIYSFFIVTQTPTLTPSLTHPDKATGRIRDGGVHMVELLCVIEDEEQAEAKHAHDVCGERQ